MFGIWTGLVLANKASKGLTIHIHKAQTGKLYVSTAVPAERACMLVCVNNPHHFVKNSGPRALCHHSRPFQSTLEYFDSTVQSIPVHSGIL